MQNNDTTPKTDESTNDLSSQIDVTRRNIMKATAGAGAAALGLGAGVSTGALAQTGDSGGLDEFQQLTVSDDNEIVNEDGDTFVMRGLSMPDPKRLERTRYLRGKTPEQLLNMLTNNDEGWYPRVIRVPAQPQDIGEHPHGHAGPEYEDGELESPEVVDDDRRKMQPPQPPAFDQSELEDYLDNYYDPIVEQCAERGVYCIVDWHRHWHEQPPGQERPSAAENHLPYDSEYTNYWAYNSHEEFGTDVPGSWGHVDQVTIEELTPEHDGWAGIESEADIPGTPYAYENWTVNQELLDEAIMFWEEAAERYGDMDHVIFEPYNEPTAPGIWGPVEGCGAIKQQGLWETFVDDFMGPIIETIRQYQPERVLLVGVPGWCQSLQGLHWWDFNDAGYDNIAITWHNYAGHDVSQMNNWFNDTNYQSPEAVEAETGEDLSDPYIDPPDSVEEQDCWGWEGYEAAGLQNAMDYHPIVVSEFGWINDTEVVHWLRGSTTGQGTTEEYGEPFFDAIEQDDRISWVGWCADPRWMPTMFEVPWETQEGELDLVNENFYDTPFDDIPVGCEELPCDWDLLGGEDSGEYMKEQLAIYADTSVPFETTHIGPDEEDENGNGDDGPSDIDDYEPEDTTGDGLYNDITGSGSTTTSDVNIFFENVDSPAVTDNAEYYDFTGNGEVSLSDVIELFESI